MYHDEIVPAIDSKTEDSISLYIVESLSDSIFHSWEVKELRVDYIFDLGSKSLYTFFEKTKRSRKISCN